MVIRNARRFVFTVVMVGIVVPIVVFWTRLPDPIATLWSGTEPSGGMPRSMFLVLLPILWCIVWSGLVLGADSVPRPWSELLIYLSGGLMFGISALTVYANLDVAVWDEAHIQIGAAVTIVAAAMAFVVIIGIAAGRSAARRTSRPSQA